MAPLNCHFCRSRTTFVHDFDPRGVTVDPDLTEGVAQTRQLKPAGIKVNSANPGYTATDMNQHRGPKTVEQGAATPVRFALLSDDGPTAGVFSDEGAEPW